MHSGPNEIETEQQELARRFRASAASSHPRAPLYAELSKGIAADPELHGLLFHAPVDQRLPVLLFACVHASLLGDPDHDLAEWYSNLTESPRSPEDPALIAAFRQFVADRAREIVPMLASRNTQTNEVARCLMLLIGFGRIADEVGPIAHLDVGCSGGLTLLSDRFHYRYEHDDATVTSIGPESTVELTAAVRGDLRLPAALPTIAARRGVDLSPIDVTDDAEARWLEACVWPDQPDRFQRLRSAIAIVRADPPELIVGDAVTTIASALAPLADIAHPVVTNTWVLNYLDGPARTAYVAALDQIGAEHDLSWVFAESPALTPELPWELEPTDPHLTVTTLVRWRSGQRAVEHLATSHPHGYWIHAH
jgi:hypothetical protein